MKLDGRILAGLGPVATMSVHKQLSVSLNVLLSNYSDFFKAELGTIVGFKAKLLVKPGTIPKFCKALSSKKLLKGNSAG